MCHYSGLRWHPKTVILHSITVESGQERSYWIFFFPLKIVQGRYFNIFNQATVVYLYYNCHQDPYLPSVQRRADVSFLFSFPLFYEDVTCIVKDGSAVFAETWLEGWREKKQLRAKLLLELSHGDLLTQTVGSQSLWNQQHEILAWANERQPCEKTDFFHPAQTNWWVTTDSNTMTYCCHGIDCVHAMSRTRCAEDISLIFLKKHVLWVGNVVAKSCWFSFNDLIEQIQKRCIDKGRLHLSQRRSPLIYKLIRESLCVVTATCHHPMTEQAGSFSRVIQYVIKFLYMPYLKLQVLSDMRCDDPFNGWLTQNGNLADFIPR